MTPHTVAVVTDAQQDPTGIDTKPGSEAADAAARGHRGGRLPDDDRDSAVLHDPSIDQDAVSVLPGTGDYTDEGDVEVDPADIHIPLHPHRDSAAPGVGAGEA